MPVIKKIKELKPKIIEIPKEEESDLEEEIEEAEEEQFQEFMSVSQPSSPSLERRNIVQEIPRKISRQQQAQEESQRNISYDRPKQEDDSRPYSEAGQRTTAPYPTEQSYPEEIKAQRARPITTLRPRVQQFGEQMPQAITEQPREQERVQPPSERKYKEREQIQRTKSRREMY